MLDYLAEVTMSILQKQKERDPAMGYARDFVGAIESVLPAVVERGVRVIANAGGVNPRRLRARRCSSVAREARRGAARSQIGVVTGDDLLPRLDELIARGHALAQHGHRRAARRRARPRAVGERLHRLDADRRGARARRATSSSPAARPTPRSRWRRCATSSAGRADDWDRLAAGIVAGHIIECGAQCSGGNCLTTGATFPTSRTSAIRSSRRAPTARSSITKHPGTGGRDHVPSVTEQLVYEMGDPHAYITPDVVADFTIDPARSRRARTACACSASRAGPPTDKLKVSIAYRAGFKAVGTLVYAWPDALEKAQLADRVLRERLDRLGLRFDQVLTEFVGASADARPARRARRGDLPEVQLRVGVRGERRAAVERFTREIAPLVLNGPPSVTGFAGGRPKVEEIVAYWPALIDKTRRPDRRWRCVA